MRALGVAGRLLLALGVLVLLFTAYQLWGTGIGEAHSQSVLRARLAHELPHRAAATARRAAAAAKAHPPRTSQPRLAPTVPAPSPGQPIGEIQIPSIGLDQVVVEGVAETDLMKGPGHYPGTPLPGEAGNVAIAGHRTTYAHPFYNLNAVTPGEPIILTTPQGVFVYTATLQQVVAPTDLAVIAATTGPTLTLTTCNPRYSAATRLVLHGVLTRSTLFSGGAPVPTTGTGGSAQPAASTHSGSQPASRGLAGTTGGGSVAGAIGWGALALAVAVATGLLARRSRRGLRRWAVYVPGTVGCLAVLFLFFGALSPLLPASF